MPRPDPTTPTRGDRLARGLTGLAALLAGLCAFAPARAHAQPTPAEAALPTEARVAFVRGGVEVLAASSASHPARAGEVLTPGLRVRTGADATAVLTLANGAPLTLDENSLAVMFASPAQPAGAPPSNTTTLVRGVARVGTGPARARTVPVPVATSTVTVWSGRADAMIAAELNGHITRMAVWRGRMRVRMGTREYLLTQGYGVLEEEGHAPGVLRVLPRAPAWRAQPPRQILSFGEPTDLSAEWRPGPRAHMGFPAAQWRVEVARDEAFRDVVESLRVPSATTRWTGRGYAPGAWHLRVTGVDADRFESAPSPVASVLIAAPMVLPASDVPPARRAAVRIPSGFYCGLDGSGLASSEETLELAPGRAHSLRCALTPSGRGAREHVISAGMSGPLQREVTCAPPAGDSLNGPASGAISVRLRDAEGEPVSLARVAATASDGVTIDPIRETGERGVYTGTVRWPGGIRQCRVRVTVNDVLEFEQEARVERVNVVPAQAASRVRQPPPTTVQVLRVAPPRDPEDDEPLNPVE